MNDHLNRHETERHTARESGWTEIEVIFRSRHATKASINLLHVGRGDSYFDDLKLCELVPEVDPAEQALTGDPRRGGQIFYQHQTAACVLCHQINGQGSAGGPALDGIASRANATYLEESLLEPNKVLAKGFEALGVSPMPPLGLILQPQEIEDLKAFL